MKITIIFLCLGLLFAFGIGEIILRILNPSSLQISVPTYSFNCYREISYSWIALIPNKNCIFSSRIHAFKDIVVKTNSLGLRNPEISLQKDEKTIRILFIGDSMVMGIGVEGEDTFARRTEKLLKETYPSKRFQSINAGVPATGPGYYYLYLKNDGIKLNPDIIVVGFYVDNDIQDGYFQKEWKDIDQEGIPQYVVSQTVKVLNGELVSTNLPFFLYTPVIKDLYLVKLLGKYWPMQNRSKKYLFTASLCIYKKSCHLYDKEKQQKKQVFLAMKKIVERYNKKLLVVIIPAEFQFNDSVRYKYRIPVALSPEDKKRPNREFGSFFAENNINFIDLLQVFEKEKEKQYYFEEDNHWNEYGHLLAAQEISKKLIELGYTK